MDDEYFGDIVGLRKNKNKQTFFIMKLDNVIVNAMKEFQED